MPKKSREPADILRKVLRVRNPDEGGRLSKIAGKAVYVVTSLAFAFILSIVFHNGLWRLHNAGSDVSGVMEGTFTILVSITFAIVSVYLVVNVLHPHFKKKPVPKSLESIIKECNISDDMTREDLICIIKKAEEDEEIKAYIGTIGVKSDIAITLLTALIAFFLGMYGYIASFTVELDAAPDILVISFCFMFVVFSGVYMILKTMKIVWDV
ncbi:hypothetical protein Mpt1_c10500 [Candidatus Methanoplasma termitum]|uniref:Uncharacterized protein n=1 Tax=Candidatus Methanoplasma termitum TaxID=1577791 RepID=A0A0A7LD35_9ARCH|nr:hypothetical protein [Candidatus Methanoplasma termitum]AIZ56918.1 hypothetical protein Mpt1_c10500 [Candidatus Methanoplasma termitum]MCL2333683.1 hypothetical protein [Candidatus Methanoplasma sp.]